MASEIPVLPLVGSRIVSPGLSFPSFSALSIIEIAARSLMDPVGLWSSSLAHSRTSGVGDRLGRPTRGVPPRESTSEAKRAMGSPDDGGCEGRAPQQPPATAGRMVTESPSLTAVSRAPVNRTSSSLTYTLTKRCSLPSSVTRRPLRPGCLASRSSTSAPRVSPLPSTVLLPPVWVRRMVGIRTSMAMAGGLLAGGGAGDAPEGAGGATARGQRRTAAGDSGREVSCRSVVDDGGRRVAEQVGLDDLDVLLGDLPVDDPEAAELHLVTDQAGPLPVLAGGDQDVVRLGLGGVADVGARRPG